MSISKSALKDKELIKRYGKVMRFAYGCADGACALYVYRITRVNEDGDIVELPWVQVRARCRDLGLLAVPQLHEVPVVHQSIDDTRTWVESFVSMGDPCGKQYVPICHYFRA